MSAREPVVHRTAARVLLIDDSGCVLLLKGHDPARPDLPPWWFVPGGGIKAGESAVQAARRELREELGLDVRRQRSALGRIVAERSGDFTFEHRRFVQRSLFFVARSARFDPATAGMTPAEKRFILGWRWWSRPDIGGSAETFYPHDLLDVIVAGLA